MNAGESTGLAAKQFEIRWRTLIAAWGWHCGRSRACKAALGLHTPWRSGQARSLPGAGWPATACRRRGAANGNLPIARPPTIRGMSDGASEASSFLQEIAGQASVRGVAAPARPAGELRVAGIEANYFAILRADVNLAALDG